MSINELDDSVAALLRQADQRYTSSRRRLVAALQQGPGPLTIAQIVEADETLPQYELAENLTEHHHHLICAGCGDVTDFSLETCTESTIDKALHLAAEQAGFKPESHRLDLHGICANCQ